MLPQVVVDYTFLEKTIEMRGKCMNRTRLSTILVLEAGDAVRIGLREETGLCLYRHRAIKVQARRMRRMPSYFFVT